VLEHTPEEAVVICQGPPTLWLYCPRQAIQTQDAPFTESLESLPADRPAYLAVDYWVHEQPDRRALAALRDNLARLDVVETVPNDLNIVSLLDWLAPHEVAAKLAGQASLPSSPLPAAIPPSLRDNQPDTILLYRIDRRRTSE
jgi:hypothetical protein